MPRPGGAPGHHRCRRPLTVCRYRLTGLSNAEEKINGLADRARWLLQDRLVNDLRADYRQGPPFQPHTEADRSLFTGQNPASAIPLAEEVLKALR